MISEGSLLLLDRDCGTDQQSTSTLPTSHDMHSIPRAKGLSRIDTIKKTTADNLISGLDKFNLNDITQFADYGKRVVGQTQHLEL